MLLVLQKSNHIFFFGSKWKPKPASSQVSLHILQVSDSPSGATAARAACPRKPEGLEFPLFSDFSGRCAEGHENIACDSCD